MNEDEIINIWSDQEGRVDGWKSGQLVRCSGVVCIWLGQYRTMDFTLTPGKISRMKGYAVYASGVIWYVGGETLDLIEPYET